MNKALHLAAAASLTLMATSAMAGKETGFYAGLSIAESQQELAKTDASDDALSYKIFGGYNFGWVPFFDVAAEITYIDFGEFNLGQGDIAANGLVASGMGVMNFGPVGIFAKYGFMNWETDSPSSDAKDTDGAFGIGAKAQIGSIAVRAEYEMFELRDELDIDYTSVGVSWTF